MVKKTDIQFNIKKAKKEAYHIPENGYIYSVYAGENHTFLNRGQTTRLHILVTLM